jgi:drug/metabolite transporter (DMT)-like permease
VAKPAPALRDVAAAARRLRRGYAMAFLSMLMDVAGSVFTKSSAVGLSPFDINAVRFGSASVSLAIWQLLHCRRAAAAGGGGEGEGGGADGATAPASAGRRRMGPGAWLKVGLGVLFCTCLAPTFNNVALFRLPLAVYVTLGSTGPLFSLPIKYLLDGERASAGAVLGAATAVGGVALLAFAPTSGSAQRAAAAAVS